MADKEIRCTSVDGFRIQSDANRFAQPYSVEARELLAMSVKGNPKEVQQRQWKQLLEKLGFPPDQS